MTTNTLIKEISITWTDQDVRQQAETDGIELTDAEVSDVLSMLESGHDATIGINWDVISFYIDEVKRERRPE